MSPSTRLERLVTRMLFDPSLVEEIYLRPAQLISAGALTQEELEWFHQIDQRRWRADPERSHRALEGLLLHLPITVALTTAGGGPASRYLLFFESPQFHDAIDSRRLLSEAFADWLLAESDSPWPALREALTRVEVAVAQLKSLELTRAAPMEPLSSYAGVSLGATTRLISAPSGALELSQSLTQHLSSTGPLAPLIAASLEPLHGVFSQLESAKESPVTLLAQRTSASGPAQVTLSESPPALAHLLQEAQLGLSIGAALSLLSAYELSTEEASQLLMELSAEGLLSLS